MTQSSADNKQKTDIVLLSSCFNDWESVQLLISPIDNILRKLNKTGIWVLVNDGSTIDPLPFDFTTCTHLKTMHIIHMHTNIGAQKALAVGLCHISDSFSCEGVVILDADGEDKPSDIPEMVKTNSSSPENTSIIFAERQVRSEGLIFSFFYTIYRILHRILTGRGIKVGNFSFIPSVWLNAVVNDTDLWNHYAASVYKSKIPIKTIQTKRGKRINGKSHMNFTSLVVHGLSAIFCYAETIGVRLLICLGLGLILWLILGFAYLIYFIFNMDTLSVTNLVSAPIVLGWLFLFQALFMGLGFIGLVLHGRKAHIYTPIMYYHHYIFEITTFD